MRELHLELNGLVDAHAQTRDDVEYRTGSLARASWEWDSVKRVICRNNCGYQPACSMYAYAKDGMVLRQELVGDYPSMNDPAVPDPNPRGCQKGMINPHRVYDPSRVKYPMKRVGERGSGQWKRVSWDEALDDIAGVLLDVVTTEGPDRVVYGAGSEGPAIGADCMGYSLLSGALDIPMTNITAENGDEDQGVGVTFGKQIMGPSADNYYHADVILFWGGNPTYTTISYYHYYTAARYNGTRVITISPDYSPSAMHADLWVPVNIGTDAALALSIAHVMIRDRLYRDEFIREQTDLPLLVRKDTGKFLREKDLKRGGSNELFYFWDSVTQRPVQAPRKTLALEGKVPALEGEWEVETLSGRVMVRPVFEVLKERLAAYAPVDASRVTGTSPELIERLAQELGRTSRIMWGPHWGWGKFYHGDLIGRAIMLVMVLAGAVGQKGGCVWGMGTLAPDFALGAMEQRGDQTLLTAAAADPRWSTWREDGYTDEMILYEYVRDAFSKGVLVGSSLFYYVHAGLLELSDKHKSWDPYFMSKPGLKSTPGDYLREALDRGWHSVEPKPGKDPRVMFSIGGDFLRRIRATEVAITTLLPKLKLLVTVDWRMNGTAMYSDYVLPACSWYEKPGIRTISMTLHPFQHMTNQVMEPLFESKNEWEIFCLLAKAMDKKAAERGITSFKDREGKDRKLDSLYDTVTSQGLYAEDDLDGVVRDIFVNSTNLERMDWEEFKEKGYAAFTAEGKSSRSAGQSTDFETGEPLVPLRWHVERKEPYPTTTRRIQFYIDHDWYLELGEELPVQKEDPKGGGDYPLRVTGGHTRWSVQSTHTEDSVLLQLQRGEPLMFVSTKDAAARGIGDGDRVEVYNDVGAFEIQVAVSPAVRPGQVIMYHGWANYQFAGFRHFKNVMATPLNPVECAGGDYHLRPMATSLYPGCSDRDTRVELRRKA